MVFADQQQTSPSGRHWKEVGAVKREPLDLANERQRSLYRGYQVEMGHNDYELSNHTDGRRRYIGEREEGIDRIKPMWAI